jgi:hypothetical protein
MGILKLIFIYPLLLFLLPDINLKVSVGLLFKKHVYSVIGGVFFLLRVSLSIPVYGSNPDLESIPQENANTAAGYRDIEFYKDHFIAVGSNGRIDIISNSGEVANNLIPVNKNDLNCIFNDNQILIAAGDNGTILISSDGLHFSEAESGIKADINSISCLNGLFIAGADYGNLIISQNGTTWSNIKLKLKGDIISLSANASYCFGVTDAGEIIRSNDGLNWSVTDYNKEYSGYNKPCIFNKILLIPNRFVIAGKHTDGTPAVLFSTMGNVWSERQLFYDDDQGMPQMLTSIPNDIAYDVQGDQFFIACDSGEILSLPSCSKCNVFAKISKNDLYGIICTGESLVTAGEGYAVNILNIR